MTAITFTLVPPADIAAGSISAQSGNSYAPNASGLLTGVPRSDLKSLVESGCLIVGYNTAQTAFGSGGSSFLEAGILTRYQSLTGAGNTNDTTEDTLFTFALPANSFDIAGRTLQITASGSLANNAHSKTAKLYFGTSIVATTGAQTGANVGWELQLQVQKVATGSQLGFYSPIIGTTHGGVSLPVAGTEIDTAAITIKVTGQTGTAAAADVVLNSLIIEALN